MKDNVFISKGRLAMFAIDSSSEYTRFIADTSHREAHGKGKEHMTNLVMANHTIIRGLTPILTDITKLCPRCNLERARIGRKNHQIFQDLKAPTSRLEDYRQAHDRFHVAIIDLLGPILAKDQSNTVTSKHWILVTYSPLTQHTDLTLLANLSTEQIFLALLKESAYTPRTIIYSDAGSNFTPLNTNFTEFTTNEKILQSLPPHWRRLLKKNEDLVKNPDPHLNFVTFAKGNHKAVGEVEFQVGKIKHLCKSIRLWSKLIRGHFTFLEVQVLLTQLQACLNSAPLYFNRGVLYTKDVIYKASRGLPDDNLDTNSHNLYELYCEGTNSLTRPLSYKETMSRKKVTQTAEKMKKCLEDMYTQLATEKVETYLRGTRIGRNRASTGYHPSSMVNIGDIVYCPLTASRKGRIRRGIYRVAWISTNSHQCLLFQPRYNPILKIDAKRPLVTRLLEDLYFICKGPETDYISLTTNEIYDLRELLEDIKEPKKIEDNYFTTMPSGLDINAKLTLSVSERKEICQQESLQLKKHRGCPCYGTQRITRSRRNR